MRIRFTINMWMFRGKKNSTKYGTILSGSSRQQQQQQRAFILRSFFLSLNFFNIYSIYCEPHSYRYEYRLIYIHAHFSELV